MADGFRYDDVAKERNLSRAQSSRAWKSPSSLSWIALGTIALATAAAAPFAAQNAPSNPSLLPAVLTIVIGAQILTAFLLLQQYVSRGGPRLLGIAAAYVVSATFAAAFALTEPGLVTSDGLISEATWVGATLSALSSVMFPVFAACALAVEPVADRLSAAIRRDRLAVIVSLSAALVAGMTAVAIVALGGSATELDRLVEAVLGDEIGWWIIIADVMAIGYIATRTIRAGGIERWIFVACGPSLAAAIVAVRAGDPFTFGTYIEAGLRIIAAVTVLLGLVFELNELYRRSERDKRALEDEALRLLRETRLIKAREARVRRVIDTAADAYIELDTNGVIAHWNTKAATLFGLETIHEGQRFVTSLFEKSASRPLGSAIAILRHAMDETEEFRLELIARGGDGREIPVEVTMWSHHTGDDQQIHVFIRDVTLHRQAEEQLQRALDKERGLVHRLQDLDRTKSDFVASISHELRSPLTSTLGYLEMLADGSAGELNAEQAHMLAIAERNGNRLLALIEDLLTLSRIETGAFSVQYKPIEISSLIRRSVEEWEQAAHTREVALTLTMPDLELGVLPGDEYQVGKAIGNVIGNAVKFTPTGGSVHVDVTLERDTFSLVVKDTGIGIPLEEQSQLFQRFFRSSTAIEQAHSGTGLGLTIARAVIEHHGGSIDILSSVEHGTTVTIVLPALEPATQG